MKISSLPTPAAHKKHLRRIFYRASFVTTFLSLFLLSACGFHLRGSYDVPSFLQTISLQAPSINSALTTEVRLALERHLIQSDGGEVQLELVQENLTRQTSTVDSSARAAEYTLVYSVNFRINRSDGKAFGPIQSLILRRSYQYNTTSVVGKNTEEDMLVHELRQDAAQQIVRQLVSLKTIPAEITSEATTP